MLSAPIICHLLHSGIVPYALRLLPNATSALDPKWFIPTQNPVTPNRWRTGFLFYRAQKKWIEEDTEFKAGISQQSQLRRGNLRVTQLLPYKFNDKTCCMVIFY